MKRTKGTYVSFFWIFISLWIAASVICFIYATYKLHVNQEEAYLERGSPLDKREIVGEQPGTSDKIIFHGSRTKKEIALTFDAEMTDSMRKNVLSGHQSFDKRIIDTLLATKTKATIFMTGMWVQLYPKDAKAIAQNPLFEVESHSYADTSYDGTCFGLTQIQDTQDLEEIETTQKIFRDTVGVEPRYFRFPGGCYSGKDIDIVTKIANLQIVHWDVAGEDGFNQNANLITRNVVDNTQNGSIIVLHLNGAPTAPKTADALPHIISQLKQRGFSFVTVAELLQH